MDNDQRTILSEVLLEISLAIGSETEFADIVHKTISLWLRRLNCTKGAFLKYLNGEIIIRHIIPTYLKKKPLNPRLKTIISNGLKDIYAEFKEHDLHGYVFHLGAQRYFVFMRNESLTREQLNEVFPVTQFFGKAIENARERERRLKVEKELGQEKRLLRTLIDHIPDSIYLKDTERNKILANQADLFHSGQTTMQDIIGKKDEEIYPREIAENFNAYDRLVLSEGKAFKDIEVRKIDQYGQETWLLGSKFPYKNEDGEIIGIVGISRDITKLRISQENVKRLSYVASQTTNGVILTDVNGKTIWINEGFTRLTGYSFKEMSGKAPGELLQGEDSDPEVIKVMSNAIRKREGFNVEIVNYKQDGTPYWIHINCNPILDDKGKVEGFMAIESDITEKVMFREELINAKNIAEKAEQAEKTFLANMSHEIRTPLNAIIGMSSLLRDTNPTLEQQDYIETLEHSSKFLLRLINDILDMAKIESGKIEVRNGRFDLQKSVRSLYKSFAVSGATKNIEVNLTISEEVPSYVIGDEVLLMQALNNILSNAVKFTDEGMVELIVDTNQRNNKLDFISFTIRDQGIGMSKEEQAVIFEKFKQVGTPMQKQKGTGLGLAITKQIIDLMGGDIKVNSRKGDGSTFVITLPFETIERTDDRAINLNSKDRLSRNTTKDDQKILVVEDNSINQKYIKRLLEKKAIPYSIANDGQEAIDLCFREHFSLILMDIQMPNVNGFEATQMIRNSNNLNKETPIIALTASAMSNQKTKALRIGMTDYLSKPFTPDQLFEKLFNA